MIYLLHNPHMMGWIHSFINYVNTYWQEHQYIIVTTLSNPTFWIAVAALALVCNARINAKLLRHFRRQERRKRSWKQATSDLYNDTIASSTFVCTKNHQRYYGTITKLGPDIHGNPQWGRYIYPKHHTHHHTQKNDTVIYTDAWDKPYSSGALAYKAACIEYITSKGYAIEYVNWRGW